MTHWSLMFRSQDTITVGQRHRRRSYHGGKGCGTGSKNYLMSYSNGKITAPVTVTDVQTALSSASKDVGALCSSTSVNVWAKYKPVVLAGFVPLRTSDWWKGTSGKCGMLITTYTSLTSLFSALAGGTYEWGRESLTGGSVSPYRLLDFDGYNHNAVNPVGGIGATSYTISSGRITISYDIEAVGSDNLTLSDIDIDGTSLDEFYLGIYAYGGTGSTASFYCTASQPFTQSTDMSIEITGLTDSYAGTYTIIPFFSSVPLSLNGTATAGTFLSANKPGVQITINGAGTLYYIIAMGNWADASFTSIEWSALGTNNNSSAISATFSVYLYRKTAAQSYGAGEFVKNLYSGSVSLPAQTADYSVVDQTDSVTGYDPDYEYYLAVTSTAAQSVTTYYPLEDYYPE